MNILWSDFLNSDWHDWKEGKRDMDRLPLAEWQQSFLDKHHLRAPVPASAEQLQYLIEFRADLQRIAVQQSEGHQLTSQQIQALNHILEAAAVQRHLVMEADRPVIHYRQLGDDWQSVAAEVAAHFVHTLREGEGSRIRICDNPDCRWIFYDDTRSRTKKYCDDKLCGNLMKVRRFRAKKRASQNKL
ncbi:CGNR zinc finger domain-containing protein [Paenibacillus wulumuqiensis]|uniref:CGNR zinc finger domain-containing protein n=1 Tax=Paenibacillus wulumuqiensis TaxID=1567107 RepID=UPI000697C1DD|nr:CGNR zinc finger domain-containing protein [Paenibacillus wulumuqiensis]